MAPSNQNPAQVFGLIAALRGEYRFADAIAVVEAHRSGADEVFLLPLLEQAFLAAHEAADAPLARKYALELAVLDPELPSIQSYLRAL